MSEPTFVFTTLTEADAAAVERLSERAFGPGRFAKTAYRLREGRRPDLALSLAARVGTLLVGANRMSKIRIGEQVALLLGPLVVEPAFRQLGLGEQLVQRSLRTAAQAGYELVMLVGDPAYYGRMGFSRMPEGQARFAWPVDPHRLLYYETSDGAMARAVGEASPADPRL